MEKYSGFEKNVTGGGRYVDTEGYGHELFNFLNDGNKCYGYTTPWCKVNLKKISKSDINEDSFGKYLDEVLVVFTCEGRNGKRVIAGFYQNARVYANAVNDNKPYITTTQQIARSREAQDKCIELKGCFSNICGFDFQKQYGNLGNNYIEVHHITPVGKLITVF